MVYCNVKECEFRSYDKEYDVYICGREYTNIGADGKCEDMPEREAQNESKTS